jgi:hypothetical protein
LDFPLALVTLAHVLILVYWLGGDLGAFYSSTLLTNPAKPVAARAAAAQVLANIDMAPRSALILAAPTGFSLALIKGWWQAPDWAQIALWAGSLAWLVLAWIIHLKHLAPASPWRRVDLTIRWLVMITLALVALAPQLFPLTADIPLFLRLKLAILAAAIGLGLLIRVVLAPFGPAFGAMVKDGATPQTDAAIARSLTYGRPIVIVLWSLLLCAGFLGIATPQ